jgi:hypothetical protein
MHRCLRLAPARRYVTETNNMTPNTTALGVGKGSAMGGVREGEVHTGRPTQTKITPRRHAQEPH